MSSSEHWLRYEQSVARQAIYLRNPLPPGPGICRTCRSAAQGEYELCYPCNQHRAATRHLADAVIPISYAIKGKQHAYNLAAYKGPGTPTRVQERLKTLGLLFLYRHRTCLEAAAGGRLTHLTIVPSTRGRGGTHPMEQLFGRSTTLTLLTATNTGRYAADDRLFHPDRFELAAADRARVLLLDDTWTTGARVQSLAYALKTAGATSVVAVLLGRHVNPDHEGSKGIVQRATEAFDISRCSFED